MADEPEATEVGRRGPGRPPKNRQAPKGSTAPKSDAPAKPAPVRVGRVGEPMGVGEARRALHHGHVAAARVLRSKADLHEADFDEMGDAFADIANHMFPALRLALRGIAPLILLGALIAVWARILGETPWLEQAWAARKERKARRDAERAAADAEPARVGQQPAVPIGRPNPPSAPGAATATEQAQGVAETLPPVPHRPLSSLRVGRRF